MGGKVGWLDGLVCQNNIGILNLPTLSGSPNSSNWQTKDGSVRLGLLIRFYFYLVN